MIIYRYIILRRRLFRTEVVDKIKTRILCSILVFLGSCRFWDNVEKYNKVGQTTDDNTIPRMRFSCWVTKATDTHTHTHTHTLRTYN
jgi:hypothetical protein